MLSNFDDAIDLIQTRRNFHKIVVERLEKPKWKKCSLNSLLSVSFGGNILKMLGVVIVNLKVLIHKSYNIKTVRKAQSGQADFLLF